MFVIPSILRGPSQSRYKYMHIAAIFLFVILLVFINRRPRTKGRCGASSLEVLDWKGCFVSLSSAEARDTVDLSDNGLTELPAGFIQWAQGRVRVLYLSDNLFRSIPDLSSLRGLQMLSLRRNRLKRLNCDAIPPSMVHLIVTDNMIEDFAGNCNARLSALKKLMMARNRLTKVPSDLRLPQLELIRLPQNRLINLPCELIKSSTILKWATFADNPCCPEPASTLPVLRDFRCQQDKELGSGTSGIAIACKENGVVFKRVKPNSSDGSFESELRISSILPKNHKAILAPVGIATTMIDGKESHGMVFPFKNALPAGLPPQFGCEDKFPPSKQHRFTCARILTAMNEAVCALADLHSAGVVHMDLYAHNTLLSESEVVFLDFGAATCTTGLSIEDARLLTTLDSRAFGTLVGNLYDHVASDIASDAQCARRLKALKVQADAGEDARALCKAAV